MIVYAFVYIWVLQENSEVIIWTAFSSKLQVLFYRNNYSTSEDIMLRC